MKRTILLTILTLSAISFNCLGQVTHNENIVTYGRFFLAAEKIDSLRQKVKATRFAGIFLEGDKAWILPVETPKIKQGNVRQLITRYLPGHIKVNSKYIKNKNSGDVFQYAMLHTKGRPLLFLSLPEYKYGDQPLVIKESEALPMNDYYYFYYQGVEYMIKHSATLHERDYPSDIKITLYNNQTGRMQLISERDRMQSTRSYIVFAGDIDGDGKVDIILDESPMAHHSHLKVYLSSAAAPGDLVGLAAEEYSSTDPPYDLLLGE